MVAALVADRGRLVVTAGCTGAEVYASYPGEAADRVVTVNRWIDEQALAAADPGQVERAVAGALIRPGHAWTFAAVVAEPARRPVDPPPG